MVALLLAYIIIISFLLAEGRARKGHEAKSLEQTSFDRGSTKRIGLAFLAAVVALLAAPLLNYFHLGRIAVNSVFAWAGVVTAMGGIALRFWANHILGVFYTRRLRVAGGQHIIQQGPYRVIRHPGYLGVILTWTGAAFATNNWVAVVVAVVGMMAAYPYRIRTEEEMMRVTYGREYEDFQARTWKLVPFVY